MDNKKLTIFLQAYASSLITLPDEMMKTEGQPPLSWRETPRWWTTITATSSLLLWSRKRVTIFTSRLTGLTRIRRLLFTFSTRWIKTTWWRCWRTGRWRPPCSLRPMQWNTSECAGKSPEPEPEKESGSGGALLLAILSDSGAFPYIKFINPSRKERLAPTRTTMNLRMRNMKARIRDNY